MGALILQGLDGNPNYFGFLNNSLTLTNCESLKEIGVMACVTPARPSREQTLNPVRAWIFFFQVLFTSTSFSSVLSCEDLLISSLHRSANMWIFIYLKSSFTWMFICTQFIDQLPVGLLTQLVERCTGIAEVMGSYPVRAWIFFRSYLQLRVSVVFSAARIS